MYENAGGIELKDTTQTSADSLEDLPPGLAADVIAGIREIGLASASRQGPDVFRAFTRQVRRLLGADRVSVSIWDPSIAAARPVWRDVTDQEESHYLLIPVGHGATGRSLATREPVVANDYRRWPHSLPLHIAAGGQAVAAVPLLFANQLEGVVTVTYACRLSTQMSITSHGLALHRSRLWRRSTTSALMAAAVKIGSKIPPR